LTSNDGLAPQFVERLKAIRADNVYTDPADRWPYARTIRPARPTRRRGVRHDARASGASIRVCNEFSYPWCARSRQRHRGGAVPAARGLVLSFERMDRILSVTPADRIMHAQAGVANKTVQEAAAEPVFLAARSHQCRVLHGRRQYCAQRRRPRALKYGATRENVLALTAVTGAGETIHTGALTTKSAVGYD